MALRYMFFSAVVLFSILTAADQVKDIELPAGYTRISYPDSTYSGFIQRLELKDNRQIVTWDGYELQDSDRIYNIMAVVDMPLLFEENLEQCADFAMRFWYEYHLKQDSLDRLYLFNYDGTKVKFKGPEMPAEKFLRYHMAYSNSYSIKAGASEISDSELAPGDMFAQNRNGGIGHVSIIVDAAENSNSEKIYLIGFGYMPAQEFHIERSSKPGRMGWFSLKEYKDFLDGDQFRRYGLPHLRRFN